MNTSKNILLLLPLSAPLLFDLYLSPSIGKGMKHQVFGLLPLQISGSELPSHFTIKPCRYALVPKEYKKLNVLLVCWYSAS